ncbi:erythrocyte membrane protein 1, EMP1 [Plasmodium reichenowi]|uniref:Erythrocyte membrane protein 1, EMP1 n=1 Tax=Plasmodium reichenowi TaxID=5854 RepID=A0A060RMS0_PLARE|nr:erythrocyte membrane protein 1, EMP1 [Plasmodium reichenowi]
MAKGGAGGEDDADKYKSAPDAKHLLDMIGQTVHEQVKNDANNFRDELKGLLSQTSILGEELNFTTDPCGLDYTKLINGGSGVAPRGDPCGNGSANGETVRFSKERDAKYDEKKIGCSNSEGACAPLRRLSLCNKNLENINNIHSDKARHNLLAEVCMAAKYEGESLKTYHEQYASLYPSSGSTMCTELARSFADIGDIVRGRDLYLGKRKKPKEKETERENLENKLKQYFDKIHNSLGSSIKSRYNGDKENFYQLREDWWTANRETVWQALTCKVDSGTYFRPTCDINNEKGPSQTHNKCRCPQTGGASIVPTYFDYVPQFLRWFEEWAEDFCRKKKKKLPNVKNKCREKNRNEEERYCSLNGFDCEQTVRARGKLRYGKQCTDCSYACNPYVHWIDNKQKEFEKQKNKYEQEINGASGNRGRQRRAARSNNNYQGYEKKFYDKLKTHGYDKVQNFLEKLNEEKACQDIKDDKEGKIDFKNPNGDNNDNKGTFYHSDYCQPCPYCGMKKKRPGQDWEKKSQNDQCNRQKLYTFTTNAQPTHIDVISFGDIRKEIKNKIDEFCAENGQKDELKEEWKCYEGNDVKKVENKDGEDEEDDEDYHNEITSAGGLCILKNDKKEKKSENEPAEFQKTFNDFFYFWIRRLLNDSIEWRNEVGKCIDKTKSVNCKNKKCNKNCDCFNRWVQQKRKEWKAIKDHFGLQKDIVQETDRDPGVTLAALLDLDELLTNIKDGYGDSKETEHIKEMLEKEKKKNLEEAAAHIDGAADNENNTTIDKLLQHEENDANKCKMCQPRKVPNPCSGDKSGDINKQYEAVAEKVAHHFQQQAMQQLGRRAGRKALKGDIKKAEFKNRGSRSELTDACKITKDYSNDSRRDNSKYDGPCEGKYTGRFKIETQWKTYGQVEIKDPYLFLPPRREHMCTSNLEKISVGKVTGNSNVNDTFLVDVLFAAKSEAENIKNKYNERNNEETNGKNGVTDEKTACRAIRRSFADIGDIIRGKDLWDKNTDARDLQGHLEKIFKEIKGKDPEIKDKYQGDKDDPKHTQLRADWWEANRETVWEAMKCVYSDKIHCGSYAPLDDYIPQRLRWMTEWAEWYCKAQKEENNKLWQKCMTCMNKGRGGGKECWKTDSECTECDNQCKDYKKFIDTWKKQWNNMDQKYSISYSGAKKDYVGNAYGDTDPDYKQVDDFLKQLHKASIATGGKIATTGDPTEPPNTPYERAAGYIHQELPYAGCASKQNVFCTSGGDKYAFKKPPTDYDDACKCTDRDKPQEDRGAGGRSLGPVDRKNGEDLPDSDGEGESDSEPEDDDDDKEEDEDDDVVEEKVEETETTEEPKKDDNVEKVCQIVGQALTGGKLDDACNLKYGKNAPTNWRCVTPTKTNEGGESEGALQRSKRGAGEPGGEKSSSSGAICVPPRRRKLYITPLSKWASGNKGTSQEGTVAKGPSPAEGTSVQTASHSRADSGDTIGTSPPSNLRADGLLKAFVESAAIETFFLWDRYKKIKEKEAEEKRQREGVLNGGLPDIPLVTPSQGPRLIPGAPSGMERLGEEEGQRGLEGMGPQGAPGFTGPSVDLQSVKTVHFPSSSSTQIFGNDQFSGAPSSGSGLLPKLGGIGSPSVDSDPNDPSNLNSGNIPNDFLRQMFYTISDYRDILVGDTTANGALSEEEKKDMENIQQKIKEHINSGEKKPNGDTPGSSRVKSSSHSGKDPKTLWNEFAPQIWHGMICALTYEDKSDIQAIGTHGTTPLKQNEDIKRAFFGGTPNDNNPGSKPDNPSGKEPPTPDKPSKPTPGTATEGQPYHYNNVELKEDSGTGPMSNDPINNPKLSDFVSRPTYFRYLEEWGETFCRERAKRLEQIHKDCKVDDGNDERCSGYGLECNEKVPDNKDIFKDFDCSSCGKSCRSYRKWIERKKDEYEKQKQKYDDQCTSYDTNNYDKQFCTKLKTNYSTFTSFLEKLKNGPCKTNENGEGKKGEDEIDFKKPNETFVHAKNCKPCSKFKIDCQSDNCKSGGGATNNKCNGRTPIEAKDIEQMDKSPAQVIMRVSDNNSTDFPTDLSVCKSSGIFTGIREDKWECRNVCGVHICTLKKKDTNGKEGDEKFIIMKELFQQWLEYFLEDYNKINKKLKLCMNKGEASPCINGSYKNCECVTQWISKKKTEWQNINGTYIQEYTRNNDETSNNLSSFLETLIPEIPVVTDKGKQKSLENLKKSLGCNCPDSSENKNGKEIDVINCMLDKLGKKIEECQQHQHSGVNSAQCQNTHPDDEEEENPDPNHKGKQHPSFCKIEEETNEAVDEGDECTAASPDENKEEEKEEDKDKAGDGGENNDPSPAPTSGGTEAKPEQTPVLKPEEEAPAPETSSPTKPAEDKKSKDAHPPERPKPSQPTRQVEKNPFNHPHVQTALASSTLAWSVGIAFFALSYWWLKKKTKSSVDMLRVLEIPQNDYGIPTKTSPNRYIPYKSAQYRGKRYIYLEGDSGTDSGYTDHYSDITSSSESEYEEFDINDIYVPHAPKYKTLIEVVLEPSKRDTLSGNIQNDDTPTNKLTEEEWNELKQHFISGILENAQKDLPNDYTSGNVPTNTNNTTTSHYNVDNNTHPTPSRHNVDNNTHPTPSRHNVDNNTHPTPSRHTLGQKPFIMSIHDRNLLSGEEYNYDMTTNNISNNDLYSGENNLYSDVDSTSNKNGPYSGSDLINDALNGDYDIYDEMLKRKENELFGTNHTKNTSNNSVAKNTNSDPIHNQLDLFHKWLDRHRDMCEKWDKNKVDILNQLKEEWNKDTNSGNKHSGTPSNIPSSDIHPSDIPSGKLSDIPSGKLSDIPSGKLSDIPSGNKTLNADVSIQIDMHNPKYINQFTYVDSNPNNSTMDNILDDMEKYNEPYYDIYYDVNDEKPSVDHINMDYNKMDNNNSDIPTKVQIEMNVINNKELLQKEYPMSDIWNI